MRTARATRQTEECQRSSARTGGLEDAGQATRGGAGFLDGQLAMRGRALRGFRKASTPPRAFGCGYGCVATIIAMRFVAEIAYILA
jgi:hypothetical protein